MKTTSLQCSDIFCLTGGQRLLSYWQRSNCYPSLNFHSFSSLGFLFVAINL